MDSCPVRVAVRVRPLSSKEHLEGGATCINLIPDTPQLVVGTDRSFTFDHVFSPYTSQEDMYQSSIEPLMEKFIDGFNATVFAYGQTGSGKTYSMGTSIDNSDSPANQGIIPRAASALFEALSKKTQESSSYKSQVLITFLELYNEELLDLLNSNNQRANGMGGSRPSSYHAVNGPTIREDPQGGIYWKGVKEIEVHSPEELLDHLYKGLICRTTASTDMNLTSSRSHAIFSLSLKQEVEGEIMPTEGDTDNDSVVTEQKNGSRHLISKFHFVDLAGSERLKKTNAVGGRAKEGISINAGLLALGNVISALGDESRRSSHVPYRNSKLTRLLQDSIGGNSQTLMLACISPAETNFLETLNTLKYANRARNIKNRVQINQDMVNPAEEINRLKSELARLRHQLHNNQASPRLPDPYESDAKSGVVARLQSRILSLSDELTRVQAEKDLLLLDKAGETQDHPLPTANDITDYAQLVSELRSQLETANFAFKETRPKPINTSHPKFPRFNKQTTEKSPPRSDNFFQANLTELNIDTKALEAELEELAQSVNTMPDFKNSVDDTRSESGLLAPNPISRRFQPVELTKLSIGLSSLKHAKTAGNTPQPLSPNKPTSEMGDESSARVEALKSQVQELTKQLEQAKKEREAAQQSARRRKTASVSSVVLNHEPLKGGPAMEKLEKELLKAKDTIQRQQLDLAKLRNKPAPSRSKGVRPLSDYPDYNTSQAHASGLRAAYKKKLIDQEIDQFLLGRVTRQALGSLIEHKDRLLVDQADLQNQRDQLANHCNAATDEDMLEALDEQLEEIEADLEYTVARVKALELKAESQMKSNDPSLYVQDDLYGEGNYRAALKILHELEPPEVPSMLELLLREIVAKRMEQGAINKKLSELAKQKTDLELFIKTLKSTTATMTLNYEARIAALQNGDHDFLPDDFDPFAPHPDATASDQEADLDDDFNYDYQPSEYE